jgi:hypothetical protein
MACLSIYVKNAVLTPAQPTGHRNISINAESTSAFKVAEAASTFF